MKWAHLKRQGVWMTSGWKIIKTGKRSFLLKRNAYPQPKAQSYNSLEAAQLAAELQEGG